jgi:UDP-glucose 4-epimerase
MKRVILTGGTGFVGANLARRLLHEGHEVYLLVRSGYIPWRIKAIRADVRIVEVELSDRDNLTRVLRDIRPEWIFHLAAHGAYSWQNDLQRIVQTNILGTINLVEACLAVGFDAFVNTGSSSEYGFKDHAAMEEEWLEPNSYYAVAKASATLFCRYTAKRNRAHIPTLRLYSVYGPYEEPGRLMPALILRGLRGELPALVNPDAARDYVYVDDVNNAYLLAANKPGQEFGAVYNVGTGVQRTLRQAVEAARRVLGIGEEPRWGSMPGRQWDANIWVADNRKAKRDLGWQPRYTFEQGFCQMVEWFRSNGEIQNFYSAYMIPQED